MSMAMSMLRAPVRTVVGVQPAPRLSVRPSLKRGDSLVVAAKGKSRMRQLGGPSAQQRPPTPPVDPDNEEFVVFVRARKLPRWIPFTIVKGGAQANVLVKAMQGNFGKEFYSKTLINNIGQAIYKEKNVIVNGIRNGFPGYKNFTEFDFGFKIRNKEKADDWMNADGIVMLPPEEEMPKGVLDNVKQSFGALFGGNQTPKSTPSP